MSFEEQLAVGRLGESRIVSFLRGRGCSVFPCYEVEPEDGKAPKLLAPLIAYIAPDLLVFNGDRKVLWCEAKHKSVFSWYFKEKRWTTGIDLNHYYAYQKVATITGLPVWILFLHQSDEPSIKDLEWGCPKKCPTGLYARGLRYLVQHESHKSDKHGRSGMVYWAEADLRLVAPLAMIPPPAQPELL